MTRSRDLELDLRSLYVSEAQLLQRLYHAPTGTNLAAEIVSELADVRIECIKTMRRYHRALTIEEANLS